MLEGRAELRELREKVVQQGAVSFRDQVLNQDEAQILSRRAGLVNRHGYNLSEFSKWRVKPRQKDSVTSGEMGARAVHSVTHLDWCGCSKSYKLFLKSKPSRHSVICFKQYNFSVKI